MDEFHYYADKERGVAWQIPSCAVRAGEFLLMSATLGDTAVIEEGLHELTDRRPRWCARTTRPVPLDFEYRETPLHETIDELVDARTRADLPGQLHAARRGRGGAEPD